MDDPAIPGLSVTSGTQTAKVKTRVQKTQTTRKDTGSYLDVAALATTEMSEFHGFTHMQCSPGPTVRCRLLASQTKLPKVGQPSQPSALQRRVDADPKFDPGYPLELAPYRNPETNAIQAYVDLDKLLEREANDMASYLLLRWRDPNLYRGFFQHQHQMVFNHWHRQGLLAEPVTLVPAVSGNEAAGITRIIDGAFVEMAGKAGLAERTLQTWRNALGGRRQPKVLKLVTPYVVPSVHRWRHLKSLETMIEWEGWSDSGEVDATFSQPNEFMQLVADTAEAMDVSFAVALEGRVGLSFAWDDTWAMLDEAIAATCPPLPER